MRTGPQVSPVVESAAFAHTLAGVHVSISQPAFGTLDLEVSGDTAALVCSLTPD
jgi:hypothetical protein